MSKILCIGDLHFKENLGYCDLISDKRIGEKKEILNFIVENSNDCETVVFLGDQFNARNNTSEVIREFTEFIERFNGKEIYIILGNHEKTGNGRSALDFLKEINNPNWHIITNKVEHINGFTFCPYFHKSELGVETDSEGTKKVMESLIGGDILFTHFAISDTITTSGCQTNIFEEILLPKKELEGKYKLLVAGHIHKPQKNGNTIIAGSIFTNEVGEDKKSIFKINIENFDVEEIKIPGRSIFKFENPSEEQLSQISKNSIVKIVLTEKKEPIEIEIIKEKLREFDGSILFENYPNERTKVHFEKDILDFDIEKMLELYSETKKVDLNKLKIAWKLINQ
jgi:predicted phosphodiesterase